MSPPLQIPSLAEWVQGEESAEFTNTLGEKITVRICDTQDGTATLLAKVHHKPYSTSTPLTPKIVIMSCIPVFSLLILGVLQGAFIHLKKIVIMSCVPVFSPPTD